MSRVLLVQGDASRLPLRDGSVQCCVTSPPYWGLRDYGTTTWEGGDPACTHRRGIATMSHNSTMRGHGGLYANTNHALEPYLGICQHCGAQRVGIELGAEPLHDCSAWARQEPPCRTCYTCHMRTVFAEVWRVLRSDGTLWVNIGDTYARDPQKGDNSGWGKHADWISDSLPLHSRPRVLPAKNLCGIPQRLALALQSDGWTWRSEIIWHKPNPMPESVQDRLTRSHEQILLFSKQARYFWDVEAIKESCAQLATGLPLSTLVGRHARSVWTIPSEPLHAKHYAAFPTELARRCILAGSAPQSCATCGAPWMRQVERVLGEPLSHNGSRFTRGKTREARDPLAAVGTGKRTAAVHTIGWQPSCQCNAGTRPALILDPFCGSGTVQLVARVLGRNSVGVDASWPYLHDIARERLGLADLARWEGHASAKPEPDYKDLPLFAL